MGENAMRASTVSFCSAVCLAIIGMIIGIVMAASGDHSVFPAHAHLNLLGWVSLFLIGIFYRLHPALDTSRLALVQVGIWICGTIILTCGVAAIYLGRPDLEVIAIAGSLIVLGDMLWFAYLVFRTAPSGKQA
jgi:cbb3-type cytochrome oxidase subunit 1